MAYATEDKASQAKNGESNKFREALVSGLRGFEDFQQPTL